MLNVIDVTMSCNLKQLEASMAGTLWSSGVDLHPF